ncbi:helix-turn-helix transcriptional regulator [Streptomyces sp. LP11]|uniref:Helix-turn-helix transcriptional regulator n=1 Tax=Streptomyces pyxinicus TaxID=2970331 RepID=A0ABT2AYB0_9ACTN|nr:helix-turn-helix transcriptional regulator [Streptomyces sp. LP11]MCS0601243.1 helix-turn-helix transcriptional regulator [Streptomyces sp. LP11]
MSHRAHGVEDLCAEGVALYELALKQGHISAAEAEGAPCLTDFGLVQPALDDLTRLEPVAPEVALHRLLRGARARAAEEHRREEKLVELFEPLLRGESQPTTPDAVPGLRILSGLPRINEAIGEAMREATVELLAMQPTTNLYQEGGRTARVIALERDQALLDRGARIRTLYQHTQRHAPLLHARYEILRGDVEARSLDELPERLLVVDRAVAFIPANTDRSLAVEVRHPPLVSYLMKVFDRLWRLATPMYPKAQAVRKPSVDGVTPRQQAIAALLVEGHTDAAIAERLGMNIRTARLHIAKLAAALGSESRAQLGYLIGRSGILDQGR